MFRKLASTIEVAFELLCALIGGLLSLILYGLMIGFYGLGIVGILYWLWFSIQLGSFWMFVVGMLPPFMVATGPIGAYAIIFGTPRWIYSLFG